ncbi:MAG: relaxase/mobilization nuclease domain-containing protein [Mogibacterium sp.]|nr:relaxase/mobilization nuclease domain-containing protein [Mogibacterium sp.]MBR0343563.1 relaxase/mobilization nuclease domain-containing protein [Oscillospiraceae bacterium]
MSKNKGNKTQSANRSAPDIKKLYLFDSKKLKQSMSLPDNEIAGMTDRSFQVFIASAIAKAYPDPFRYLFKENSESNKDRVLHYDTIGIVPGSNEFMFSQFAKVWKRADKLNWIDKEGAVFGKDGGRAHDQAILTITSFSEEDFPKQPNGSYTDEQVMAAMDIVLETHKEMGFPQVILVAQNDGEGGYLHIHGFANAVDPVTNKTLDKQYSNYRSLKRMSRRRNRSLRRSVKKQLSLRSNVGVSASLRCAKAGDLKTRFMKCLKSSRLIYLSLTKKLRR